MKPRTLAQSLEPFSYETEDTLTLRLWASLQWPEQGPAEKQKPSWGCHRPMAWLGRLLCTQPLAPEERSGSSWLLVAFKGPVPFSRWDAGARRPLGLNTEP